MKAVSNIPILCPGCAQHHRHSGLATMTVDEFSGRLVTVRQRRKPLVDAVAALYRPTRIGQDRLAWPVGGNRP